MDAHATAFFGLTDQPSASNRVVIQRVEAAVRALGQSELLLVLTGVEDWLRSCLPCSVDVESRAFWTSRCVCRYHPAESLANLSLLCQLARVRVVLTSCWLPSLDPLRLNVFEVPPLNPTSMFAHFSSYWQDEMELQNLLNAPLSMAQRDAIGPRFVVVGDVLMPILQHLEGLPARSAWLAYQVGHAARAARSLRSVGRFAER